MKHIAVLGAGISGLMAAWRAHQAGDAVTVYEAAQRVGGVIQSERRGGWLIERGPHTLQWTAAVKAATAVLPTPVVAGAHAGASGPGLARFVVRSGRMVPLPASPPALLAGKFFSVGTKARLMREFLGRSAPSGEVSFGALIRTRFGDEAYTWAAQPFVSGIYAGDPEQLSARYAFPKLWAMLQAHGSLLRGQAAAARVRSEAGEPAAPALVSFADGMAELPAAVARQLPPGSVRLGTVVSRIESSGGSWTVEGERFDEIVVAVSARAAAKLTINGAQPLSFLADIPHPPVTALCLGFPREAVMHPLNGFGCLVPAAERRSILGIIFSSSLFSGRAPEGHVAFTVMLGGALQPLLAKPNAAEAWRAARQDVRELLGINTEPVLTEASHWPAAIPQFTLGYGERLEQMRAAERRMPGIRLAGSYRHGIALPSAFEDHAP